MTPGASDGSSGASEGRIIDRYRVLRAIGRGGMAEVWLVQHQVLGSLHALKVPRDLGVARSAQVLREGRAQAALDHPHSISPSTRTCRTPCPCAT